MLVLCDDAPANAGDVRRWSTWWVMDGIDEHEALAALDLSNHVDTCYIGHARFSLH